VDTREKGLFADFEAELEKPRAGIILEMSRTNNGCENVIDEDSDFTGDALTAPPKAGDRESLFEP